MAGRGPADIGFGLATGGGWWRGRGSLTSGLAAVLAAVFLVAMTILPATAQCVGTTCTVTTETELRDSIDFANANPGTTISLQNDITLTTGDLPALQATGLIISGGGNTLSGDGTYRGLFAYSGDAHIEDLTIEDAVARGGDGGGGLSGAGGGGGLGGALFVNAGAAITVSNVTLEGNAAVGGDGGSSGGGAGAGGGGGGLGGNGGSGTAAGGGGGGGIGNGADGGGSFSGPAGGSGIVVGAAAGGNGAGTLAGAGGADGGGGGGGGAGGGGGGVGGADASGGIGGRGGFGGGAGNVRAGGFGGGGGGGGSTLGVGGFGGGGGSSGVGGGSGGFGGGAGANSGVGGGGGGGAGMGGAVFVVEGGTLIVEGNLAVGGSSVAGGSGGGGGAGAGSAFGSGLFLQGNGTLSFQPSAGQTQTIADVIADQTGSGGTGNFATGGPNCTVGVGCAGYSGAGSWSLTKTGAGTLELNGDNSFTGGVMLDGGTLIVNGSIAASSLTTVNTGATLGGTGTVGNATINGGALSPGNSVGTLVVDGDVTFNADAFFDVEIDGITSDLLDVTDTATLAGTVRVAILDDFTVDHAYTILTAGSLAGTFDALDIDLGGDFLFLTPTLSYNPTTTVFLTIEQASFATGGTTPNQMAVGGAIDQLGAGNPIYDEFLLATDSDLVQMTLDSLSGEQHAATGGALLASGETFLDLIADRFHVAFGGGPGALGYADDGAQSSALAALGYQAGGAPPASGRAFWIAGLGAKDFVASDGNGAAVDTHSGGIAGGFDGAFDGGRAGLAFGYGHEAVRVPDRSSSADVDSARIGAWYAGGDGPFTYGVAASYAHHWIATERAVMGDTASADYTAHQASLLAEAGYDAVHGDVVFRPIAALRGGWLSTGAFAETGAGAANLSSSGETYTALDGILGVKVSATRGGFAHWARVAWEHAFLDTAPMADLSLGGVAFAVAGAAHPRDRIVVGLGVEADIGPRARAGIAYAAAMAHGYSGHHGRATVAVDF